MHVILYTYMCMYMYVYMYMHIHVYIMYICLCTIIWHRMYLYIYAFMLTCAWLISLFQATILPSPCWTLTPLVSTLHGIFKRLQEVSNDAQTHMLTVTWLDWFNSCVPVLSLHIDILLPFLRHPGISSLGNFTVSSQVYMYMYVVTTCNFDHH